MPFGYGEVEPVDKRFSRSVARMIFLGRIREETPEVLRELADLPFRMFCDANVNPAGLWPLSDNKVLLYSFNGIHLQGFHLSLLHWARRWHLEVNWLLDNVCWTLDYWRRLPQCLRDLDWIMGGVGWMRLNDSEFSHLTPPFGFNTWEADSGFRGSYVKWAKEQIEKHIEDDPHLTCLPRKMKRDILDANLAKVNEYCDEVIKVYLSKVDATGKPTWKLAESKTELLRNISWTIGFQVLGKTYSEIARAGEVHVSTVKREVESTLSLIGLPKRPDAKPGRRRGSNESENSWRRATKRANLLK